MLNVASSKAAVSRCCRRSLAVSTAKIEEEPFLYSKDSRIRVDDM